MPVFVHGGFFFTGKIKDLRILLAQLQQGSLTVSQLVKQNLN